MGRLADEARNLARVEAERTKRAEDQAVAEVEARQAMAKMVGRCMLIPG